MPVIRRVGETRFIAMRLQRESLNCGSLKPMIRSTNEENGSKNMRGSGLVWTIVGVLVAVALVIWIVSAM
jgi:hypothetical protein